MIARMNSICNRSVYYEYIGKKIMENKLKMHHKLKIRKITVSVYMKSFTRCQTLQMIEKTNLK